MIYLFNSGFRDLYRRNVLNTLFLPPGATNQYRYRYRGDSPHVEQRMVAVLQQVAAREPVAIVFIDRFAEGGYRYYPIRLGNLVQCSTEADRIFFRVVLGETIWPRAPETTSSRLFSLLAPVGIPRLRQSSDNRADGYYAVQGDSLFGEGLAQYFTADRAWTEAAEALSHLEAFRESPDELVVFSRLVSEEGPQPEPSDGQFRFHRTGKHTLRFQYLVPANREKQVLTAAVTAKAGDGLKLVGSEDFYLDSYSNAVDVSFAIKKYAEEDHSSIWFGYEADENRQVIAPTASLAVEIVDQPQYWLKAGAAVLAFALGSALLTMTFPNGFSIHNFLSQLTGPRAVGSIFQAGALLYLARLVGKKVL